MSSSQPSSARSKVETVRYVRSALPGDICILLLPTAQELTRLREFQTGLQGVFGGQIVEHVHVTCQRFKPDHAEQLWQIINRLVDELAMVKPFPLLACSLVTLQSEFWHSHLARWQVQETTHWQSLNATIRMILQELSCQPHYHGDKMPTCSALEQIPVEPRQTESLDLASPEVLFEARQVIITKIEGQGYFTTLKTFQLGHGISETTGPQPQ